MPANLATINGRIAMAYVNEIPWHRVGTQVSDKMNVEEAMKAASLDWDVEFAELYVKLDKHKVYRPLVEKTEEDIDYMKRAVIRSSDCRVLGVVGRSYELLSNSEAFSVLKPACEQHGVTIDTAGALGRGDVVWMLAKLPESIEPVPGDKVDGYFLVTTGHNGYTSYEAMLTPIRVVCQNTLTIARNTAKTTVRLRHTKSELEQVEMVAVMVNELATGLKQSGEIFKKLAKKKWNAADVRAYVNAVLKTTEETEGVKAQQRDDVIELAYHGAGTDISKGTAWAAYNAVTEYVDHVRTQKNVRMLKARDASSIFGLQAQLKARALEMALDAVK